MRKVESRERISPIMRESGLNLMWRCRAASSAHIPLGRNGSLSVVIDWSQGLIPRTGFVPYLGRARAGIASRFRAIYVVSAR
jgi:hypothetical protein